MNQKERMRGKLVLVALLILVLLFTLVISYYSMTLTGFTLHDLSLEELRPGVLLRGSVMYDLPEKIPQETGVYLDLNGFVQELPLNTIIDPALLGEPKLSSDYPSVEVTALYYPVVGQNTGFRQGLFQTASSKEVPQNRPPRKIIRGVSRLKEEIPTLPKDGILDELPDGVTVSGAVSNSPDSSAPPEPEWKIVSIRKGVPAFIPAQLGSGLVILQAISREESLSLNQLTLSFDGSYFVISTNYEVQRSFYEIKSPIQVNFPLESFNSRVPPVKELHLSLSVRDGPEILSEIESISTVLDVKEAASSTGSAGSHWDGLGSTESLDPSSIAGCTLICTSFGACTAPSLNVPGSKEGASRTYVRSRLCYCQESPTSIFVDQQSCRGNGDSKLTKLDINQLPRSSNRQVISTSSTSYSPPSLGGSGRGGLLRMRNLPVAASQTAEWRKTLSATERDLAIQGAMQSELAEQTRLKISFQGDVHSVGVRTLAQDEQGAIFADVEVASEPQQARLYLGQQAPFDLNGDGLMDVGVTFVNVHSAKASLIIEPLALDGPIQLSPGEQGIEVRDAIYKNPLAYLILKGEAPSYLNIILAQSSLRYSASCSNLLQDGDEEGVDCGPSCRTCQVEQPFYARIISLIIASVLGIACAFVFGRQHLFNS